jgi:hypothetical protein
MRAPRALALALAALLATAGPALASPIQFNFRGVITSAGSGAGVSVGQAFSGSFSYDPNANLPWVGVQGSKNYAIGQDGSKDPSASFVVKVGDKTLFNYQGALNVNVQDTPSDGYWFPGAQASSRLAVRGPSEVGGWFPTVNFSNPERSVFAGSVNLPSTLDLRDFPEAELVVQGLSGGDPAHSFDGQITSLSVGPRPVPPVPEPAWATGACLALAVLINLGRRRRAAAR